MELIPVYSTPFWQAEYPDFQEHKEKFLDAASEYKKQNESVEKNNIYGYQSPETLQLNKEFSPLFNYVCLIASRATADLDFIDCDIFMTSAWLNINDTRQCMNYERVGRDVFSGFFHLKVPENSGKIIFHNPGLNGLWSGCDLTAEKNQFTGETIRIDPIEGNIILFPSYISHSIETNNHDDETIFVTFNIIALPKGKFDPRVKVND